jgi:hypothetical protein
LSFFGLQAEDKSKIHEELFAIIISSEGAFTYSDVYNLPVYLRKYYVKLLERWLERKKSEVGKIGKKTTPSTIQRPAVRPK